MSNFDPTIPNGATEPSQNLRYNETTFDFERNNTSVAFRTAQTASATVTLPTTTNYNARGMIVNFNIASLPGSASTTLACKIRGVDPVTGSFFTLLNAAARSATGLTTMMIGPGISASALGVAALLPRNVSILVSQSSGATSKDTVWSIGIDFTV